jgi:uncharacterized protein with PIN domain
MTTVTRDPQPAVVAPARHHVECYECGVVFWMTQHLYDLRLRDHRAFYCPVGHGQHFIGETEVAKYKRLAKDAEDRAAAARAERDQAEAGRRAWKGQTTRLKNQALKGLCPFCGQSIAHLARHVARVHPDEQPIPEETP